MVSRVPYRAEAMFQPGLSSFNGPSLRKEKQGGGGAYLPAGKEMVKDAIDGLSG